MRVQAAGFLSFCAHGDVVAFLGCEMRRVGAGGAALDACIKGCLCLVTFFSVKRAALETQVSSVRASVRSQTCD